MKKIIKSLLVITMIVSYFLPTIQVFADSLPEEEQDMIEKITNTGLLEEKKEDGLISMFSLPQPEVKVYTVFDEASLEEVDGIYPVDRLVFGENSPIVKMVVDNSSYDLVLEDTYHQVLYVNNMIYRVESLLGKNLQDNPEITFDFSNLSNGSYSLENVVFDSDYNIIYRYTLDFEFKNSTYALTSLTLDDVKALDYSSLIELLVNYSALSEEDKSLLEIEEDANLYISNLILNYDEVIVDLLLNYSQAGIDNYYDSKYEVNEEEIKVVTGIQGTFDYNVELGLGLTAGELKTSILQDSIYPIESVSVFLSDGTEALDDKVLETGMTVVVSTLNLTNTYHIIVKGNLVNEDGIIDENDFDEIVLSILEMSELSNIYQIAADINEDKIMNIFDIANLVSDYAQMEENNDTYETEINLETPYKEVMIGDTFTVHVVSNGLESYLTGLEGLLKYDPNLVSLDNVYFHGNASTWFGNANIDATSSSFGKFIYLGLDEISSNETILTFEFTALKEGNITIGLSDLIAVDNRKEVSLVNNQEDNSKSYEVTLVSQKILSSDASIEKLTPSTGSLSPSFSKDITSYQLFVPNTVTSITIDGILSSAFASTDGFKTYALDNQYTSIEIVVTAEDGTTKTYTIHVMKYEVKSSDNYLTSLEVKGYDLKFNKYTTNYDLTIASDVKALDLTYLLSDENATVEIIGNTNLKDGDKISIIVTAENGNQRTYTITVHKEESKVDSPTQVEEEKDTFHFTKLILILLIIAVIIGLIYMLFKNDKEENEKMDKLINKSLSDNHSNVSKKETPVSDKKQNNNKSNKNKNVKRKS